MNKKAAIGKLQAVIGKLCLKIHATQNGSDGKRCGSGELGVGVPL